MQDSVRANTFSIILSVLLGVLAWQWNSEVNKNEKLRDLVNQHAIELEVVKQTYRLEKDSIRDAAVLEAKTKNNQEAILRNRKSLEAISEEVLNLIAE